MLFRSAACALRTFAQGGEQAQAIRLLQGLPGVGVRGQRAPVREQLGSRLQRIFRVFVEVHVGKRATTQQQERFAGIVVAHGVREWREVQ